MGVPTAIYTRHAMDKPPGAPLWTPRVGMGGTGAVYLRQKKKLRLILEQRKWQRSLLRMVRANDRGQISALSVADHLANLNNEVHKGISDKSVGPRCIVVWRNRRGGVHHDGGGQQFYTGTIRDPNSSFPSIVNGMDMQALVGAHMPLLMKSVEAILAGQPPKQLLNDEEVKEAVALLPDKPDERLR
jgi:hypothetical protein